jgi:glycine dehydrogenase
MYIAMMGADGLTEATKFAILNANYISKRLAQHFPTLYRSNDLVAHECIIDVRGFKEQTGIEVEDIAKRLIDYGFHSPTMSFPVAGTLMIEPTESESLQELDRFCTAMVSIRSEIENILDGRVELAESSLRNAPHSWIDVSGVWDRPYSIAEAFPAMRGGFGYLPPVNRIDAAFGDRNLQCTCAPISSYADSVPATNPDR